MDRISTRLLVVPALAGIVFILTGAHSAARAQTPPAEPQAASQTQTLSADQLNDLVAPIALYPDGLLSQVLVASTYPLEVVEAQQWLQQNSSLSGTQLTDAAKNQSWDPSVQALVALPDVLNRLNQDVRWTTDLGNAFLAQESDVMAAVQRMRASAQTSGRLTSTAQQTVSTETQDGQQAITIQPANPDVVYVPSYDPNYVWGPPAEGYYPSLAYPNYGYDWGSGIDLGWGGWGWGPNWFGSTVFIDNDFFRRHGFREERGDRGERGFRGERGEVSGRIRWTHDPGHRLGVPYPNQQLSGRFQGASAASRANQGGFGMRGPLGQPTSGRPGMPINPQGVRGMPPQGGASRMIPNPGTPMQPRGPTPGVGMPRGMPPQGIAPQGGASRMMPAFPGMVPMRPVVPGFGGGIPRGFAPGGGFRGNPGFGGRGFGGGFSGGHGFGGGGGHR